MSWIILAAGAQFISAIVALIDKYIVTDVKVMPRPFVYAFYTCLISGGWIVIYLFSLLPITHIDGFTIPSFANLERPTLAVLALSFLSAYTFFYALVSMFTALQQADTSDVVPVIGAVSALGSFALGYYFFGTQLSPNFIWGILLLTTGTVLVSRLRFPLSVAMNAVHAGLFFALHYIAIKAVFMTTSFDDGFFWSRVLLMLFALSLLLVPMYYEKIVTQTKKATKRAGLLVLFTKILAGISSLLVLKATDLGDVAVVQALGGLQFVFILGIGILIGHKTPSSCGEESCRRREILQKCVFVALISLGVLMLFA